MGNSAWRAAALLVLSILARPAGALESWTFSPDITVRFTATDNVLFTPEGESDFITQVTPGLRLRGAGARLRASFEYEPSVLFYSRHDEANDISNRLRAVASLEAVEKFFFIDVDGAISQQFLSPFAPRPGEITIVSGNRAETRSLGVTPSVRGQLGGLASYEVRNRNLWTTSEGTELGDSYMRQWNGAVRGPIRLFGWAVEFDDTEIEHDSPFLARPDQRSSLVRGRLYWQPDISWRFSVSAGRERNNYIDPTRYAYSDMHGVGLVWSPSVRTTAELEYEKRFFGPSRKARFQHRTRLTAWQLAYSKDTTNYQQEVLRLPPGNTAALLDAIFAARIPDPVERAAAVQQFLRNSGTPQFLGAPTGFFTQQVFLQERLEGSFGILGVRNSITLTLFAADSETLSGGVGSLLPELGLPTRRVRTHGFGVNASHRVTPFTTLTATAGRSFAAEEEPAGRDTRNDNVSVNLSYRAGPRTTTFAGVTHTRFTGDAPGDNRRANSIHAGLTHQF